MRPNTKFSFLSYFFILVWFDFQQNAKSMKMYEMLDMQKFPLSLFKHPLIPHCALCDAKADV